MAFVADTRMIANCWLRPGNSSSANNVQAFLANTLHHVGGNHVSLLRADSGFSDSAFLDHLEPQQMHYVIALRQNQPTNLSGACIAAARTARTESKNSNTISPPTVSICRIFGRPKRRDAQYSDDGVPLDELVASGATQNQHCETLIKHDPTHLASLVHGIAKNREQGRPLWAPMGGIKQDHVLRTWFVYSQRLAYLHHRGKAGITCPVTAPCKVLHA
jgi:Transposase DDE domain group 1